jgi:hypothetical protein
MLKNFKIYTDFNGAELEKSPNLYAVCEYKFHRNRDRMIESVRIEAHYTERESRLGNGQMKPEYQLFMTHTLVHKHPTDREGQKAEFHYAGGGYDVISILHVIGDTPAHREFLNQIGFHE